MIRAPHYPASPHHLLVHTPSNLLTSDRTIRSRVHPARDLFRYGSKL